MPFVVAQARYVNELEMEYNRGLQRDSGYVREAMQYTEVVKTIADLLKVLDSERPIHKKFRLGIVPFGERNRSTTIAEGTFS